MLMIPWLSLASPASIFSARGIILNHLRSWKLGSSKIEFETQTQKSLLGSHAGPLKNRHTVRGPLTITQAVITVIELTSFHVTIT